MKRKKILLRILLGIALLAVAACIFSVATKHSRMSVEYQQGIHLPVNATNIRGYNSLWIFPQSCGTIGTEFEMPEDDFWPWLESLGKTTYYPYHSGDSLARISEATADWFSIPDEVVQNPPFTRSWWAHSPIPQSSLRIDAYPVEGRRIVYLVTYLQDCD